MKAQPGSRGIAALSLDLSTRWGSVVSVTLQQLNPWEGTPAPIEIEAGWSLELVWTYLEMRKSPALTKIRTLVYPACTVVFPTPAESYT
jgi:hypothetical protein